MQSLVTKSIGLQIETYTEAEFNFDHNIDGDVALIDYFNGNGHASAEMGVAR